MNGAQGRMAFDRKHTRSTRVRVVAESITPQLGAVCKVLRQASVPLTAKDISQSLCGEFHPWDVADALDFMEWQRRPMTRAVRMRDGSRGYCHPTLYRFLDMAGRLGPERPSLAEQVARKEIDY